MRNLSWLIEYHYEQTINEAVKESVLVVMRRGEKGADSAELSHGCKEYRKLDRADKELVHIALVKIRDLACVIGAHGAPRFFARCHAPEGAFSVADRRQQQGEIIARAAKFA